MSGSAPTHPPLGGLTWSRLTRGNLSSGERRRLLTPILQTTTHYAAGRLRMALGLHRPPRGGLDLDTLRWPESAIARAAEEACHDELTPPLINHSYRTYVFALSLAALDGARVDQEELFVCALLHDLGLAEPVAQHCFAARGAERAEAIALSAGAGPVQAARLAEIIAGHITPGFGGGLEPMSELLASGALVDITGLRLWDCDPRLVRQLLQRYPRLNFKRVLRRHWRREAAAVPAGRAALIERVAWFSLVAQLAPFDE